MHSQPFHSLNGKNIVVASHNAGKLREFADLMAPFGFEAKSAKDYGLPEPDETGTTFEENAYIKAFAAAKATGLPALSDDSGLCVDALGGAPGVYTANWAEKPDGSRDFGMAMQKTETALQEAGATEPSQRSGRFVAVICLVFPDGEAEYYRGEAEGRLVWPPRGNAGAGPPGMMPVTCSPALRRYAAVPWVATSEKPRLTRRRATPTRCGLSASRTERNATPLVGSFMPAAS